MQQAWRAALLRFDAHGQAVHDSDGLLVTQRDAAGVRRVVAAGKTPTLMREGLLSDVFGLPIEVHEVAGRPQAVFYAR